MKVVALDKLIVNKTSTIKETMRTIDANTLGVAFVVDNSHKLIGIATDGDIRRAIIEGTNIRSSINDVMNKEPIIAKETLSDIQTCNLLKKHQINIIPRLNEEGIISSFSLLHDLEKSINNSNIVIKNSSDHPGIKTILVIGGAGFIGSVLVRKLLAKGYKVKVLDNFTYGDEGIKDIKDENDLELIDGDIRNIQTVVNAVKGADAVAHLAAIVGDPACDLNAEETVEINYLASKMIAEVCKHHQVNRLVFISTCSVYGASSGILNEESELNPVSLYAETKIRSEQGILSMADENFSPCILRLATVYGTSPRMRFDLVVNTLTARAIQNGKFAVFGGDQWRPNVHVQDVADAIITCFEAPIEKVKGEVYNIGSNEQNYQIYQLGEIVQELIPGTIVETITEDIDKRDYNVSFDKAYNELGYSVKKTIEDAVLEIKELFDKRYVSDFSEHKYSNYQKLVNRPSHEE
ncbi:NAD-dependent epimerase/dehydratase family protein [Methanococcoides sp. SA1]|nr:NAD-dependent epimerase/dehydratase family protein [Methanococcoides sp. SA1]